MDRRLEELSFPKLLPTEPPALAAPPPAVSAVAESQPTVTIATPPPQLDLENNLQPPDIPLSTAPAYAAGLTSTSLSVPDTSQSSFSPPQQPVLQQEYKLDVPDVPTVRGLPFQSVEPVIPTSQQPTPDKIVHTDIRAPEPAPVTAVQPAANAFWLQASSESGQRTAQTVSQPPVHPALGTSSRAPEPVQAPVVEQIQPAPALKLTVPEPEQQRPKAVAENTGEVMADRQREGKQPFDRAEQEIVVRLHPETKFYLDGDMLKVAY